jgi:CRISPR/Cas system Type II protein with McrA/HNH and RuvC-like nuclease domain
MFHCENDLLANLIVLSPKLARKRFRESIFEEWEWKCAYCDKELNGSTATIDHIVPKHKGGHSTRNNLACACSNCNKAKGSQEVFEYLESAHKHYSEQRVDKIKQWLEQKPCSLRITSTEKSVPYLCNDATIGWIAI